MVPGFPYTGTWYDYLTGEAINVSDLMMLGPDPGDFESIGHAPARARFGFQLTYTNPPAAPTWRPQLMNATTDDGTCSYLVTFSVDLGTVEPNAAGVIWLVIFKLESGDTPLQLNEAGVGTSLCLQIRQRQWWGLDESVPTSAARQMARDSTDCGHSTQPPLPDQPWSAGRCTSCSDGDGADETGRFLRSRYGVVA